MINKLFELNIPISLVLTEHFILVPKLNLQYHKNLYYILMQ